MPLWNPASGGAAALVIATTLITGGVSGRVLYDNAGALGEYAISGTGSVVMTNGAALVTPALGVATATSLAIGGATVGSNALAVTGTSLFSSLLTVTQGTANTGIFASTGYSLTGSNATNMVSLAGTWNTSGLPTGIKFNVTNTASDSASLLFDFQVGGNSILRQGTGNTAANGLLFGVNSGNALNDPTIFGFNSATLGPIFILGASQNSTVAVSGTQVILRSDRALSWNSAAAFSSGTADLLLVRDAANVLAQRNSTTAQQFNVYNTWTDASNYERAFTTYSSNVLQIGHQAAGTGTATRIVRFFTNSISFLGLNDTTNSLWNITSSGHFVPGTANSRDVGISGNGIRRLYATTGVILGPAVVDANVTTVTGATPTYSFQTGAIYSVGATQFGNDALGVTTGWLKTRAATAAASTVVVSGDAIGGIEGWGADGTAYRQAGYLRLIVDGTPGSSDMPGRWEFGVTPDGSATPATALTIKNDGSTQIASGKNFWLGNNAVTGLTAGVLSALTNASIVLYDLAGQPYRIPCII